MKISLIHIVLFAAICIGILIHLNLKEGFQSSSDDLVYTKDHCGMIVSQINFTKERLEDAKRSNNVSTVRDSEEILAALTSYKAALTAPGMSYDIGSEAAGDLENVNSKLDQIAAQIAASTGISNNTPKRKTLLQRFRNSSEVIGNIDEYPIMYKRERQMSFSLPERSLLEQSNKNAHNKTYYDMLDKLRKKTDNLSLSEDERREKMVKIAAHAAAVASKNINNNDYSSENSCENNTHKSTDSISTAETIISIRDKI